MNNSSALKCHKCESTDIELDYTTGQTVCQSCYLVLDEDALVSELTFQELAGGASHAVGSFISTTDPRQLSLSAKQSGVRAGKESREQTLLNGKRLINKLSSHFQLRQSIVDASNRIFGLAANYNFIQGRKTTNVVAACTYIACRQEVPPVPLFLIDFSDVLQTNVFQLGTTLMKFCQTIKINLPLVDPSIYVHRFASQLEFDKRTHAVALTAMRLVRQMQKDWLAIGRRPAGICGACLLLAARIHGFQRSHNEIAKAVKVAEVTIRKRLEEFENSSASYLTIDEFNDDQVIDQLRESNPPCYIPTKMEKIETEDENEYARQIRDHLGSTEIEKASKKTASMEFLEAQRKYERELEEEQAKLEEDKLLQQEENDLEDESDSNNNNNNNNANDLDDEDDINDDLDDGDIDYSRHKKKKKKKKHKRVFMLPPYEEEENQIETLSDFDDGEIDREINTEAEAKVREILWQRMHGDYEKKQEEKRRLLAEELARNGGRRKPTRRRKRRNRNTNRFDDDDDEEEEEHVSHLVNLDAYKEIFGDVDGGSPSEDEVLKTMRQNNKNSNNNDNNNSIVITPKSPALKPIIKKKAIVSAKKKSTSTKKSKRKRDLATKLLSPSMLTTTKKKKKRKTSETMLDMEDLDQSSNEIEEAEEEEEEVKEYDNDNINNDEIELQNSNNNVKDKSKDLQNEEEQLEDMDNGEEKLDDLNNKGKAIDDENDENDDDEESSEEEEETAINFLRSKNTDDYEDFPSDDDDYF